MLHKPGSSKSQLLRREYGAKSENTASRARASPAGTPSHNIQARCAGQLQGCSEDQKVDGDEESLQIWQPCKHSDFSCPICLQTATLPVETNCGHLFCGSCLITYWKHSPWLAAITCPLCRQKVVLLDSISCEKEHDKPSKQIVHDIRDYNKRFSGQPRPFADYLYDMPLFLTLALRGIFTWGVLVWLFFLRVAVCSFGTIVCLSSPFDMKPEPLCRTLGTADDMVVVSLLLICMINICQQIAPNGVNMARSAAQSMLSEA